MPHAGENQEKHRLRAELLGELRILSDGSEIELPASKKTRALLGYLLASERRRTRSELCDLLWEDAEDPRAALRWSLSKLRTALGRDILIADRNTVELNRLKIAVDLPMAGDARNSLLELSSEHLSTFERRFRGEFLNGLELPSSFRFYEWCQAERSRLGLLHDEILQTLISHVRHQPEKALEYAHKRIARNPFEEAAHICVIELLSALGRQADVLAQAAHCRKLFAVELGIEPTAALDQALVKSGKRKTPHPPVRAIPVPGTGLGTKNLQNTAMPVGRIAEIELIRSAFNKSPSDVVLIVGVPGIGKSTTLEMVKNGYDGRVIAGRAFEAEQSRPFGVWLDALESLDQAAIPAMARHDVASLLSGAANPSGRANQQQVFDAVVTMLSDLATDRPVLVELDDLQWVEPSSCALLNYASRKLAGSAVHFCLAARAGEIDDNDAAQAVLVGLRHRLNRVALTGLPDVDALAILKNRLPEASAKGLIARAQGNPLYLLELARMGDQHDTSDTLRTILASRINRLSQPSISLLSWAAVFGRTIYLETLLQAAGLELAEAFEIFDELERHNILQMSKSNRCAFSHDLIRQAAYQRLSNIRRKLMHGKIANTLAKDMQSRPETAVDVLHHSAMSDQSLLAARAAVIAAERAARVYANAEAVELAKQGLIHAKRLDAGTERISLSLRLQGIQVLAASGPLRTRLPDLASDISTQIAKASQTSMAAQVAQGEYLLSVLYQEAGDHQASQLATARAADAASQIDARKKIRQWANSARCLLELGRNIPKAETLIEDAAKLADQEDVSDIEVFWSQGLLAYWHGDLQAAARNIDMALHLARQAKDRWRECKCLTWAATIALENNLPDQAIKMANALNDIAGKIGESAFAPLAQAILAIARRDDDKQATAMLALEAADDKSHLAFILNLAAEQQTKNRNCNLAIELARKAYAVSIAIDNQNEKYFAQALARLNGVSLGDPGALHNVMATSEGKKLLMARVQNIIGLALQFQASHSSKKAN